MKRFPRRGLFRFGAYGAHQGTKVSYKNQEVELHNHPVWQVVKARLNG
jgi:hypothetical protein